MYDFDYRKPVDLEEALSLRRRFGKSSRLLMGGTDLLPAMDGGGPVPELLIDLKGIEELGGLEESPEAVEIGAGVTYTDLIRSTLIRKKFPGIWESSRLVASTGIRNVATLAGNICNAVPSAESAAPLLVRDALVRIASSGGNRTVPVTEFFTGPRKTVVTDREIVTAVSVPFVKGEFGESYVKLGRYRGEDIAQAAVAVLVDSSLTYRIAYAAVGPVPLRIPEAESLLQGRDVSPELLAAGREAVTAAISPISDIRASKEYRLHMCRIMFDKAVTAAAARMAGTGPEYGTRLV